MRDRRGGGARRRRQQRRRQRRRPPPLEPALVVVATAHAGPPPAIVAVVGPHDCDVETYRDAREVGRLLGGAGFVVATGGGSGVMEAAARGAVDAGAVTVGFLPAADTTGANPYLTVAVPTGLGEGRNVLLVTASRAVVAVGASWGTESEIALAMRAGTPVVSLHGWTRLDVDGQPVEGVLSAADPAAAVAVVLSALRLTPSETE